MQIADDTLWLASDHYGPLVMVCASVG